VWWCKTNDSSSLLVYAVKNEHLYPQWSHLMSKAQALSTGWMIYFLIPPYPFVSG